MGKTVHIVVIAQEMGQAQVLAPVLVQLADDQNINFSIWGHRQASEAWREVELEFTCASSFFNLPLKIDDAKKYLIETSPDLVIYGASSPLNKFNDLTSLNMGVAARQCGIPTATFLDHWQGIDRFFKSPEDRVPEYAPDFLGVLDRATKYQLIDQLPNTEIQVIGHPHLEIVKGKAIKVSSKERIENRRKLGIKDSEKILVLASQITETDTISHDRQSLLSVSFLGRDYLDVIKELALESGFIFLAKAHPADDDSMINRSNAASDIRLRNLDSKECLNIADAVIGWDSMLLVHAAISGIPAISVQCSDESIKSLKFDELGICARTDNFGTAKKILSNIFNSGIVGTFVSSFETDIVSSIERGEAFLRQIIGLKKEKREKAPSIV